jgi:hypothetical protein
MNARIIDRHLRVALVLGLLLALGGVACGDDDEVEPTDEAVAGKKSASGAGKGGSAGSDDEAACVAKPTKSADFAKRCTDSQCEPFDNEERLPLYEKGKPLPEVP